MFQYQKNHYSKTILDCSIYVGVAMTSFSGRGKYSRESKKENVLDQETRNSIFQLIKDNEGLHFRKICRMLDKKMGVVQYHVSVLEKGNFIRSVRDGRYKCFFCTDRTKNTSVNPDLRDKDELQLRETIVTSLRRKTPQVLIKHLATNKTASHQTLSNIANVSPQAITFHTQRLANFNIIKTEKDGRQKFYSLTDMAQKIISSLDLSK
jgi:predicted transcriptional regulator